MSTSESERATLSCFVGSAPAMARLEARRWQRWVADATTSINRHVAAVMELLQLRVAVLLKKMLCNPFQRYPLVHSSSPRGTYNLVGEVLDRGSRTSSGQAQAQAEPLVGRKPTTSTCRNHYSPITIQWLQICLHVQVAFSCT